MAPKVPIDGWRSALAVRRFRVLAFAAPVVVTGVLLAFRRFLEFVEARPGAALADPVLPFIAPRDVSAVVFTTMYLALLLGLVVLARRPDRLVPGLWAYAAMLVVRAIAMYLVPLDPPAGLVPLRDPFVDLFGEHRALTRDLFFSGHTATLFLLALVLPMRAPRIAAMVATFIVATGTLVHHAHYTIDVIVAPFAAYACHRASEWLVEGTPD
jgi:hypothetical protein